VLLRALHEAFFGCGDCPCPGRWLGTLARVAVPIDKAAPDELGERGMKPIEIRGIFRRAYGHAWSSCIWETAQGDAFFNRRGIAFSQPLCSEWMVAFHQQLEDQNTQAKGILFRRTDDAGKMLTL
jgi:hypothetical protein